VTANKEPVFWMTDESWWFIGDDNKFHLTDKAPDRAVKSFELFNGHYDHKTGKTSK